MSHFLAKTVQLLLLYEADSRNSQTTCRHSNSSPFTRCTSVCNATGHPRGRITASGERRLCKLAPKEVAYIHALSALTDATACQSRFINATSETHLRYDYLRCLHARTCIAYTYDIHVRDTRCNYTYIHVSGPVRNTCFQYVYTCTGIAYL